MDLIRNNIEHIKNNIAAAARKRAVAPEDITLIGVTKTIDIERINLMVDCGVTNLGENRVQELINKYPSICSHVNWHLIGHLQTNKVKYIIDKVKLIHSVDSFKLATEINNRSSTLNKITDVLIEINIANEDTKFGVFPNSLDCLLKNLSELSNLRVKGLMTVLPFVENPEENRKFCKKMFQLFVDIRGKNYHNIYMDVLSMGMTNDYVVAIEEGANMVRIGTAIFGHR